MRTSLLLALVFAVGCRDSVEDADLDGVPAEEDCDDNNADVRPGATELCNGVDDDCDGTIDQGAADASTFFADADGDGAGDEARPTVACEAPADHVAAGGDCDDANAAVAPTATELCNGVDDDCDGEVDEEATDALTFYVDVDGDGHGSDALTAVGCEAPEGFVADADDCNDGDDRYYPGAAEADCSDPNDYNCDGSSGYADADGDGFAACEDCDDTAASRNSGAPEVCNDADDDCDGENNEAGAVGEAIWFVDADTDGFGATTATRSACDAPDGYVADSSDCNDASADAYPGGTEVCDDLDNNCDGRVDEASATDATTWYGDGDGDGFGVTSRTAVACALPVGFAAQSGDCDDVSAVVYPGANEICDALDNDCNGQTDEGFDLDNDGVTACAGDCDESRTDVNPNADEVCDGVDNDCDGGVDVNAVDPTTWFIDYDGDGYGVARITVEACEMPTGFAATDDDCDDVQAARNPGAAEVCDGRDMNCDGEVDNDDDGDGFAAATCGGPDCDDTRGDVNPDAAEMPYNGRNDDCDVATRDDDLDRDGFVRADECDDANAAINPDADEIWYDGIDQDCDGANDYDQDGDGHDAVAHGGDDCDDTDASRWNVCYDGNSRETAGLSCRQIKADYPSALDDSYWLDPDEGSSANAFEVWCDMNDDLGGWTLIARYSNADAGNWMTNQGDWWYDRSTLAGNPLSVASNADMISPAFWTVAAAELRITRSDAANDAHLLRTTSTCLNNQSFRARLMGFGVYRGTQAWGTNSVRHTCAAVLGGVYSSTQGFGQATCSSEIGAPNSVSFYSDWGQGDGAVLMIGGGGNSCTRADHGIGITEANDAAFDGVGGDQEGDFGNAAPGSNPGYALNLWVR